MTSTVVVGSTGLVVRLINPLNPPFPPLNLQRPDTISSPARQRRHQTPPLSLDRQHPMAHPMAHPTHLPHPNPLASSSPAWEPPKPTAGSISNQYKIDHDLNLALATAAKKAGVKVDVLISSKGAHPDSRLAYPRMKGELEEGVKSVGFERTVFLRPGLILENREESRRWSLWRGGLRGMVGYLGYSFVDGWSQDKDVIVRAAVSGNERRPQSA